MSLPNYHAWDITPADFAQATTRIEQAHVLIRYAVLAANSHNTQSWRFQVGDEGHLIELRPDYTRALPCSDPDHRQLHLSVGCALGTLCVAAIFFGFDPVVSYHGEREPVVRIHLRDCQGPLSFAQRQQRDLFPFITQRRMNRAPYHPARRVDQTILNRLHFLNDEQSVRLCFVKRAHARFAPFLDLAFLSTCATQEKPGIIAEWARWFRPVETQAYDGVPPFDFAVPESALSAFEQALKTQKLFATAPVFLILGASRDDLEHQIRAGKVLAWLSLAAEQAGLSHAPWGAVIEDRLCARRAADLVGIAHPLYFARLGYADARPHHSPRRPLAEVVDHA